MPGDAVGTGAPQVAVLGPLEVSTPAGAVLPVRGTKQRALLSLLVLHRNRAVSASRLVHGLWGDHAPRGAEVTLRSHVSHLRPRLAEAGLGGALTSGPAGYRIALAPGQVDVDRFEDLAGRAQESLGLGFPGRAAALVRQAQGLWRGAPFDDLEDVEAAAAEAARLEELRLGSFEVLASAELASGRHREIVADLEALVDAHPFREGFCAQLMVALYRSGRQSEALAAYAAARERLADELGLDPGPELQALSQRVLRQDPVLLGDADVPAAAAPRAAAGVRPVRRPPDAVFAALARARLVGRATEAGRVATAWQAVAHGGRRLVLLSGDAGIGKSHLAAGIVQRATDEGAVVLVGRCDAAAVPYEPVASALRSSPEVEEVLHDAPASVAGELAPLLDGPRAAEADPARAAGVGSEGSQDPELSLYSAVTVVLRRLAAVRPVVVVVENAERIDRASALLLRHALTRLPSGILIVVTFRDPPGGRHPPLLELLGNLDPAVEVDRITLGPLNPLELADLVRDTVPDIDGHAERFWQHTGGNPFYAKEMAQVLAEGGADRHAWDVPLGVRDVLRHRLTALSEPTREVLPVAAVLGSTVDVELLAQVVRLPEDRVGEALDEAVAEGLLVESGSSWQGGYTLPHDLVRDALRSTLTGFTLRSLHLRAAEALMSRRGGLGAGSGAIAAHLRAAGPAADPAETARYSLEAAAELRSVYAWDEAVEHAEAAVRLLEPGPAGPAATAALTAGLTRLRSGRGYHEGVALLEVALRQYLRAGDEAAAGAVHSRIGGALCLHHSVMDVPRALEHFAAAERLLPAAQTVYHLHRGRSHAAMLGLRTGLLGEAAARAETIATTLGRRDLTVLTGWAAGWAALNEGRLADAAATWERAWATAHELADPYLGWSPVNAAALAANAYLLDPETARAWCRRGLGQPRFTAFTDPHGAVVDQLALALAAMGDLEGARGAAERLPEDAVANRMLLFLDGQWERAERSWAAAAASDESAGDLHDAALNLRWLATARLALGDDGGARAALGRALSLACEGPQVPTELDVRAVLAQVLAADDHPAAEEHLARCEEILAGGERWCGAAGQVELARAAVAAGRGDDALSDDAAARAVDVFAAYRLPWRRAAALQWWAGLLDRRGSHAEALKRRREGHEVLTGIGAADRWLQDGRR